MKPLCAWGLLFLAGCYSVLEDERVRLADARVEATERVALAHASFIQIAVEIEDQSYKLRKELDAKEREIWIARYTNSDGYMTVTGEDGEERPFTPAEFSRAVDDFSKWTHEADRIHKENVKLIQDYAALMGHYYAAMGNAAKTEADISAAERDAKAAATRAMQLIGAAVASFASGMPLGLAF